MWLVSGLVLPLLGCSCRLQRRLPCGGRRFFDLTGVCVADDCFCSPALGCSVGLRHAALAAAAHLHCRSLAQLLTLHSCSLCTAAHLALLLTLLQGKEGVHWRKSKCQLLPHSALLPLFALALRFHVCTETAHVLQGKEGVHWRKSKFELIEDGFVQNSGLKQMSYQASGRTAITGRLVCC